MSSLTEINLSNNLLTTLHDDAFSGLSSLSILNLEGNQLTDITNNNAKYIKFLSSLTSLNLKNNNITSFKISSFNYPNMLFLDLSHNQLTDFELISLKGFTALTDLRLNHNSLTLSGTGSQAMLKNVPTLTKLVLNNNQISDITDQLSYQIALQYLDLSNNQITTIDSSAFSNQQNSLQKLGLENNGITTQSQSFDGFSSVSNVCFKDNSAINSSNSIYDNNVGFTVTTTTCCSGGVCFIP